MSKRPNLQLETFVPYRLSIASNAVSDVIAGAYQNLFEISIIEWRLITILAEKKACNQIELAKITRMDKVTVNRGANTLVARKFVVRKPKENDRRSHLLALTTAGQKIYKAAAPKAQALEKKILKDFSRSEVTQLITMLLRLESAALNV